MASYLHCVQKKLPLDFRLPPVALTPHYSCLTDDKVVLSPVDKEEGKKVSNTALSH
jgi:hypothetical protein